MTKKIVPHSNLRLLSILGLICVLLVSLTVVVACEEEEEVTYTLTIAVSPSGGGTTSPSAGTHTYDEDTVVTITATAASGYVFDKWSGASTATTATTTVTMTSNKTVTANFEEEAVEYTLTMAKVGTGTVDPDVGDHDYAEDTVVTITATAATGWEFDGWTGDVADATAASTTVTMDEDQDVTATFTEVVVEYTLTMAKVGTGTVDPDVGDHDYADGTVVDITATPATGWEFGSWTGDVTDEAVDATTGVATAKVTMDADQAVTATFLELFTLTMAVDDVSHGATTPVGAQDPVADGTVVNITATAEAGWLFDNWTVSAGAEVADPNAASTTVTVDADKTVTANFVAAYTLTMAVDDVSHGTTTPAVGAHVIAQGATVDITATAEAGWLFENWTVSAGAEVADPNAASTTVTMDADKTVTANFVAAYTLSMAVNEAAGGTTDPAVGDHVYAQGTVVDITATAATNWQFDNWTGDVADPNAATTTVTMDADKTVTANFSSTITYTLTMTAVTNGSTDPAEGAHPGYNPGEDVAIAATPAEGYEFVNWTGDVGTVVDVDAASTTITMDGDYSITANFAEAPTGPAVPAVDTEWVYECTYGTIETTTWTYTVTDVASAGAEAWAAVARTGKPEIPAYPLAGDCYITEVTYSTPPERQKAGTAVTITGATNWVSQTTFDNEASFASINLFGMDVATYMTNTYTGDHGWDLSANTAWSYVSAGMLNPPLSADFSTDYDVVVTGTEEMLSYTCYHIEYWKTAADGVPVDPAVLEKEEWWCPDISGLVKSINYTGFDEVETLTLTSTTA